MAAAAHRRRTITIVHRGRRGRNHERIDMKNVILFTLAASALLVGFRNATPPAIRSMTVLNFNGTKVITTAPGMRVGYSRDVVMTGPWLDYTSGVIAGPGISGTILEKKSENGTGKLTVRLRNIAGTSTGLKDLSLLIACPPVPFTDCNAGPIKFKAHVLSDGPISKISPPSATTLVPINSAVQFTISGTSLSAARILTRLTNLTNVSIVGTPTSTQMVVRGTTGTCGSVSVGLIDKDDVSDLNAYRFASGYTSPLIGGKWCPGSFPPPTAGSGCPNGYHFDYSTIKCEPN
jgi:hypothetical protein